MIPDAALPPGFRPPAVDAVERHGILYGSARWSGESLGRLAERLVEGRRPALLELSRTDLLGAWRGAVDAFLDPGSPERRALDPAFLRFCRLSRQGLQAGLEAVLGGVRGEEASELVGAARPIDDDRPALVVLAGNLPGLAVQPLLPALALRRPVLLKSPSVEPFFAPAFLTALGAREPRLTGALAAVTWKGGDRTLEAPLLAAAGRVLAYGEEAALEDLARRGPGKVVAFGPRTSLAVLGAEVEPEAVTPGLARDVALFDQRGCLSIEAIFTAGDPRALADALAGELARLASLWPPGPADPAAAAGVQQLRAEADLRGLYRPDLPLAAGTVVVEPLPEFRPGPGLRTVRVHPLEDLDRLPELLASWRGRLQGAALAGRHARSLRPRLEELDFSRFSDPGELQSPGALWHNGGLHPLAALGGTEPP